MNIRSASLRDATQIQTLVESLAPYYLDQGMEALPAWFGDTLSLDAFLHRLSAPTFQSYIYEEDGRIVVYISIKDGNHLYHLFVAEEYQRRGIARCLWEHACERSNTKQYTLRSSLYAVPFYQRLGFRLSGPIATKEGIVFQPMVLER